MNINARKLILGFLPFLMVGASAFAQNSVDDQNLFKVNDAQIREFVKEVYAHEADMVFNDEQRMKDINDLLKNRIKIYKMNEGYKGKIKDMQRFSSISLLNFNNKNLKKESFFDPQNFNPLKYNFNFYPRYNILYSIGNSYVIVIVPQEEIVSQYYKK